MEGEKTLQQELRQDGYSQEEAYFNRVNRALIEKRRRQLDQSARAARRAPERGRPASPPSRYAKVLERVKKFFRPREEEPKLF